MTNPTCTNPKCDGATMRLFIQTKVVEPDVSTLSDGYRCDACDARVTVSTPTSR
jgi:hypothetical protein